MTGTGWGADTAQPLKIIAGSKGHEKLSVREFHPQVVSEALDSAFLEMRR